MWFECFGIGIHCLPIQCPVSALIPHVQGSNALPDPGRGLTQMALKGFKGLLRAWGYCLEGEDLCICG